MTGEEIEQPVAPPRGKEPETLTIPKADWERVNRRLAEVEESERVWAQRARGGNPAPEPEQEEEPIDTDGLVPEVTGNDDVDEAIYSDPEKWTEALTKGPKAIESFVKKMGYVSAKEAAEIAVKAARGVVESRVQAMQADNQLVGDYGDLKDPNSELFKAAAPIYQKLVRMNGGKQSSALLYAAAGQAKAVLDARAPKQPKPRDDDYDRYEPEEERRARARAQGSDRGRPAPVQDDEAGELGPEALEICRAMGCSPEEYAASQKRIGKRRR